MENTVVGLFDRFEDAQAAVRALVDAGFPREEISLIANDVNSNLSAEYQRGMQGADQRPSEPAGSMPVMGGILGGLVGVLAGIAALAIPGIGPVLAAGPLVAILGGAGAGALAGGMLGALVGSGISEEDAQVYAEGVRRGGTLVTVYTNDTMADRAADLMNQFDPVNIEQRVNEWEGWLSSKRQEAVLDEHVDEAPAEGPVLGGRPYEAGGSQQPKRARVYSSKRQ